MFWENALTFCKVLTIKQAKKVIKYTSHTFFALQYLRKDNLRTIRYIFCVLSDEFWSIGASV